MFGVTKFRTGSPGASFINRKEIIEITNKSGIAFKSLFAITLYTNFPPQAKEADFHQLLYCFLFHFINLR